MGSPASCGLCFPENGPRYPLRRPANPTFARPRIAESARHRQTRHACGRTSRSGGFGFTTFDSCPYRSRGHPPRRGKTEHGTLGRKRYGAWRPAEPDATSRQHQSQKEESTRHTDSSRRCRHRYPPARYGGRGRGIVGRDALETRNRQRANITESCGISISRGYYAGGRSDAGSITDRWNGGFEAQNLRRYTSSGS